MRTVGFRIAHNAALDKVPKNLWVDENLFSGTGISPTGPQLARICSLALC